MITFWIISLRDFVTLVITCYYCYRVNKEIKQENQMRKVVRGKLVGEPEAPDKQHLNDFKLMLDSSLPHYMFCKYLEKQKPELSCLMQILIIMKQRKADLDKANRPDHE